MQQWSEGEDSLQDAYSRKLAPPSSEEKVIYKETQHMERDSDAESRSDGDSDDEMQGKNKRGHDLEPEMVAVTSDSGEGSDDEGLMKNACKDSYERTESIENSCLNVTEDEVEEKTTETEEYRDPVSVDKDDAVKKQRGDREGSLVMKRRPGDSDNRADVHRTQEDDSDSGDEAEFRENRNGSDEEFMQKQQSRTVQEFSPGYESSTEGNASAEDNKTNMSLKQQEPESDGNQMERTQIPSVTYSRKRRRSDSGSGHELPVVKENSYSSEELESATVTAQGGRSHNVSKVTDSSEDESDNEPLSKKKQKISCSSADSDKETAPSDTEEIMLRHKRKNAEESESDDEPLSKKLKSANSLQTRGDGDKKEEKAFGHERHSETGTSSNSGCDSGSEETEQGGGKQKSGSSANKRMEKKSQEVAKHPKIVRMKRYLREAGIRVQNYNTLWQKCNSIPSRVRRMQQLLEEKGLKGKPTLTSCKKLRKRLEKKQEVAELDLNLIIQSGSGDDSNRDEEDDCETSKVEKNTGHFPPGTNVWAKWRQGSFERVARPAVVIHMDDVPSEFHAALKRKAEQPGNIIVTWLGDWNGWYKVVSAGTVRHLTDTPRDHKWARRSASVYSAYLQALTYSS